MIINVTYGGSAPGVARYIGGAAKENGRDVPGTEERATLLGSQGFGFPVQTQDDVRLALAVLRRDVELQASNTKPVENTVIHASMSWPQGYEPSRKEMLEASEHLAKAWGMEAHRRISWSHEETKHRHIHTFFGSIHPDTGYAHHDHELNDRAQRAAIEFERKYGIPPTRQKDHDKAMAAEASDHARTMELSKNMDGSILRRSLDRALSLGGHLGPDKIAQRKEFIEQNDLTKFPQHTEQAYAPPEVAREKRDYIRDNHAASSDLARAYKREAGERARGVGRLYEDYSFEKTSKPPTQEERQTDMGVNDILDWPWKKAGEIIKRKWQEKFPSRAFGKEVEEKGWDHPEVKRQWEKKYGPAEYAQDQEKKEDKEAETAEQARVQNWKTQRERNGSPTMPGETPPWSKDAQRSSAWRREKDMQKEEADSRPLPETSLQKWYREQMARPRPDAPQHLPGHEPQRGKETPALSRPKEIPMPKIEAPSEEIIEKMNQGAIEREERKMHPASRPFFPEQSREDGTAGRGRKDRTQAGQPGILPGGSHEHGSPSQQFHDQLTASLRDIKPPKREIGKDRERER